MKFFRSSGSVALAIAAPTDWATGGRTVQRGDLLARTVKPSLLLAPVSEADRIGVRRGHYRCSWGVEAVARLLKATLKK